MSDQVPNLPYLYLHEGITLAQLSDWLIAYDLEAAPKERYYYDYKDAIRIIDFVQTKGVYDGWVLLIKPADKAKANQLLEDHPDKFKLYAEVERQFLDGLSNSLLEQALGSQHATGERLELIRLLLAERGITTTDEQVQEAKTLVKLRNEERSPKVQYAKVLIWTGIVALAVAYLWWVNS